ncbi:FAD-dependent oxidoreductase [Clostridium sp. AM58-1XD]|uniref:NAD(P)/FAD-dependent oxidoreductase n=1 Tax=Clostridium sp. AM58-1XD TaxID=2292307 RepID=UPI000E4A15BE|nr:FAD-dependent oxidoreductase [Clostridium sp. AM58-1XD]RGY97924.1 NAD(P)/FAD-dependent oxidoreductase [Clostridium sp. AM58-1XD]
MKYAIIGSSAAGISAAEELRKLEENAEITVISMEDRIYSRCMLHKYLSGERTADRMKFIRDGFFTELGIRFLGGRSVISIQETDHMLILDDGSQIIYDKLLIAAGASYYIPPIPNFRDALNVLGFRSMEDADKLIKATEKPGRQAVIIGGGLIGLDTAYGLEKRGCKVTLIEKEPYLMPLQTDAYVSDLYREAFERAGCNIMLNAEVKDSTLDENERITHVILDDGTEIPCDFVIAATSVKPRMEFLNGTSIQALYMNYHIHTVLSRFLKKTDIHVNKGLEVDGQMRTSSPDIYAAGDVTGLSAIWPDAKRMGKIAAASMCGGGPGEQDFYQFKNMANFYGIVMFSAGKTRVDEKRYEVLVRRSRGTYRKLIIKEGVLEGVLMVGDVSNAGVYLHAVSHHLNIEKVRNHLFRLSFADWYGYDETTGEFCYQAEEQEPL